MTPCTLFVRLCDLIVQSHGTERDNCSHHNYKCCKKNNSTENHVNAPAAHTRLHTKANTTSSSSSNHASRTATSNTTSSSFTVSSSSLPPSTRNDTATNNYKIYNKGYYNEQCISSDVIENSNEEEQMELEFDINGLYVILRHGKQVHRSSELTSGDEITTKLEEKDEILADYTESSTEQEEELSNNTNTECKQCSVEVLNNDRMRCNEGMCNVEHEDNELHHKQEEQTKTIRRGKGRLRRMYEWNELFVFTTNPLQHAKQVPLTESTEESDATMNTSGQTNINNNNDIYNRDNMYQDKYNKHTNVDSFTEHTEPMPSNVFYQEQYKHQECKVHNQSEDNNHCTCLHGLFDEIVIELWVDAANEALCLARGQLDINSVYEQLYCNNLNNNECSPSDLLNSHTDLQTQVEDKTTENKYSQTKRRRINSQIYLNNNFVDNDNHNDINQQEETNRTNNTELSKSSSKLLHLGEDDHVIDLIVPLTSNLHVALSVKIRMQCVGLHRLLLDMYHKEMEAMNKAKIHEFTQASSVLLLPTNAINRGITPSPFPLPILHNYNYGSNNDNMNMSDINNSVAITSTIPQPPFFTGAQHVAFDHTNYNYNYHNNNVNNNYIYNNMNNNSSSYNNYAAECSPYAPILTPSPPPLLVPPLLQPPNMHNSTVCHPGNYFPSSSYYPPITQESQPLSQETLLTSTSQKEELQQQSFSAITGATEQVQPHNVMHKINASNNVHYFNRNSNYNNTITNNNFGSSNNYSSSINYDNCVRNNTIDWNNTSTVNNYLLPSHSSSTSSSLFMEQIMPSDTSYAYNNNNPSDAHYTTNAHLVTLPFNVLNYAHTPQQQHEPMLINPHEYNNNNNNNSCHNGQHNNNNQFTSMPHAHFMSTFVPYKQQQQEEEQQQQQQHEKILQYEQQQQQYC